MILIGQYDSPFVRRVGVTMTLYEIEYEHWPWSVWANADGLARINPLRRVPVLLLEDGEALVESSAILDALDSIVGPTRALVPMSGPHRRAALRIAAFATGLADKAVSLLYEHVLRPDPSRSQLWEERCRAQIRDTLNLLESERAKAQGPWWLGDKITHGDVAVGCALRFLSEAHPDLYRSFEWPALERHRASCEAMPPFQEISQPLDVHVR